jgi:hypothetical protein
MKFVTEEFELSGSILTEDLDGVRQREGGPNGVAIAEEN